MIKQLTVFLENDKGRLASLCRVLGEAGISMRALTVADTHDFGVARIICNKPEQAADLLNGAGYRAKLADVYAVGVPDHAGGLADLLEGFDEAGINVEYAYCFSTEGDRAVDILRVEQTAAAAAVIVKAGFKDLDAQELYNA
jgi:hypothetical protein